MINVNTFQFDRLNLLLNFFEIFCGLSIFAFLFYLFLNGILFPRQRKWRELTLDEYNIWADTCIFLSNARQVSFTMSKNDEFILQQKLRTFFSLNPGAVDLHLAAFWLFTENLVIATETRHLIIKEMKPLSLGQKSRVLTDIVSRLDFYYLTKKANSETIFDQWFFTIPKLKFFLSTFYIVFNFYGFFPFFEQYVQSDIERWAYIINCNKSLLFTERIIPILFKKRVIKDAVLMGISCIVATFVLYLFYIWE